MREINGKNITQVSNVREVWSCINDILKPETVNKSNIKIETEDKLLEDPQELAEEFNKFFKDKVEKLAARINKTENPFSLQDN